MIHRKWKFNVYSVALCLVNIAKCAYLALCMGLKSPTSGNVLNYYQQHSFSHGVNICISIFDCGG